MTLFQAFGQFAGQAAAAPAAAPGMVLLKATSITHTSGSATLGTNGQVTYSGVSDVSLDGIFTSEFKNYVVWVNDVIPSSEQITFIQMRVGGVTATATNYAWQNTDMSGTTLTGLQGTSQGQTYAGGVSSTNRSGNAIYIFAPFLAQPTTVRGVNAMGTSGARINDNMGYHSLSTSYDGFLFRVGASTMSGTLSVYGIRS